MGHSSHTPSTQAQSLAIQGAPHHPPRAPGASPVRPNPSRAVSPGSTGSGGGSASSGSSHRGSPSGPRPPRGRAAGRSGPGASPHSASRFVAPAPSGSTVPRRCRPLPGRGTLFTPCRCHLHRAPASSVPLRQVCSQPQRKTTATPCLPISSCPIRSTTRQRERNEPLSYSNLCVMSCSPGASVL